jgi:hypothetical protein
LPEPRFPTLNLLRLPRRTLMLAPLRESFDMYEGTK